jgi:hypothetical protein
MKQPQFKIDLKTFVKSLVNSSIGYNTVFFLNPNGSKQLFQENLFKKLKFLDGIHQSSYKQLTIIIC